MIRLQRVGRKHDPSFRIIVTEKERAAKTGNYIEMVGSYDARTDKREVDGDRIKYWISKGAQISDTLHNILVTEKVIDAKKINVLPKNKNRKPEPVVETPKETPKEAPKAEVVEVAEAPAEEVPAPDTVADVETQIDATEEVVEATA